MLFIIHRSIQPHCPEQWSTCVSFRRELGWPYWNELVGDKLSLMLSSSAGFVKQGIKSDQMQLGIRRAPVIVSFLSSACFIASRLWKARVCKLPHYSRYSSHGLHTACLLKYRQCSHSAGRVDESPANHLPLPCSFISIQTPSPFLNNPAVSVFSPQATCSPHDTVQHKAANSSTTCYKLLFLHSDTQGGL